MACFVTIIHFDLTSTTIRTSLPFSHVLLVLLGLMSTFRSGVVSQSGPGYCTYKASKSVSHTSMVMYSEMVRTTKDCGFWNWDSCTIYREAYKTRPETRYRKMYRSEKRCCPGWISAENPARLTCVKIPDPTTAVPVNGVSDADILTPEKAVNYSIVTDVNTAITIATIEDTTDPGTLPGGPVSDAGRGGLFHGERGKRNLIGLIVIVAAVIFIVIGVTLIAVCYRKRRKRERKLSDTPPELELLNQGVSSNNGRVGESAYAEIPEGQTEETALTSNNTPCSRNVASTNGNPEAKGANQYQEIAELLQAEGNDLPPPPPLDAHMPDESRGGYAYAYVHGKLLSREGDGGPIDEGTGHVELKADGPTAKYAEVHKKKSRHPKSPGSANNGDADVAGTSENDDIPTTIQAYITHIPSGIENNHQSNLEAEQGKGLIHDNPEPYGEVEIGGGLSQNKEYDNFQRAGSKPGYTCTDVPKPYGELGPTSSPNSESTGYDKIQRSNSRQDSIDACEEPMTSGYGVVLSEAVAEKTPVSNTYGTLDNQNQGTETSQEPSQDTYDRLDRQISTTSMPHGSPTKTRSEKLQKKSPTYSKLNRSTSRQDASIAPSPEGYGVLGDERRGNIPPQVYDRLDTGNQLSASVPVQEFHDYGHMEGTDNRSEIPANAYNSLKKSGNPPESAYATIPNDMDSSIPSETYDKLQRGGNDIVAATNQEDDSNGIQYDTIGPRKNSSSVYDTPIPAPDRRAHLTRKDTLYENTPKGNQESSDQSPKTIGRGHGGSALPTSSTYDTPSTRNSLTRQDSRGEALPANINYDTPPFRNSITRQDSRGEVLPASTNYDSPPSRNSVDRQDTIYENAAKQKRNSGKPGQYEEMEKGAGRNSNISTGSYYEEMKKGNRSSRGSRGSLDASIPSPFGTAAATKQDTLYENTAREGKS